MNENIYKYKEASVYIKKQPTYIYICRLLLYIYASPIVTPRKYRQPNVYILYQLISVVIPAVRS